MGNVTPMVSIIVPTYNYAEYISETLECLQKQSIQDWECIIIDDGSTDNTVDIVNTFVASDTRFIYIYQTNQRQASAKNNGIRSSSGKYLQFLDSDDLLQPEKLQNQVEFLEKFSHVDIIYGSTRYFNTSQPSILWLSMNETNIPWMIELAGRGKDVVKQMMGKCFMTINSPMLRRSVIEDVGFFDESLYLVEDWEFWIRCCIMGKFLQYKEWDNSHALVRIHPKSISKYRKQLNESTLEMRSKIELFITDEETRKLNTLLLLELQEWIGKIQLTKTDLDSHIPAASLFILVDEDQIRTEIASPNSLPFPEHNEQFWGLPADDAEALLELKRLIKNNSTFLVIAWPAFWWREHYKKWYQYIVENYLCIAMNERILIYQLNASL